MHSCGITQETNYFCFVLIRRVQLARTLEIDDVDPSVIFFFGNATSSKQPPILFACTTESIGSEDSLDIFYDLGNQFIRAHHVDRLRGSLHVRPYSLSVASPPRRLVTRGTAATRREDESNALEGQRIKNLTLRPIGNHPQRAAGVLALVNNAIFLDSASE